MNKKKNSVLSNQLLLKYIVTIASFIILFPICFILIVIVIQSITWQAKDPLYQILSTIRDYSTIFMIIGVVGGFAAITFYYILKPLNYLDEVVKASSDLINPTDKPIELSPALRNIQNELNLARAQSLRLATVAKEAEQRKNDMIVYLAHDLKTPLTSVIGYLNLLKEEPDLSPELRGRYTGIALDKAERLEYLINEFFEITRFNLTNQVLNNENINLSRMVEQITFEFNPILNDKELTWDIDVEPDIEFVGDVKKMERVFDNLIRNAVNYSYDKTVIHISLKKEESIIFKISNQGKTIPPEILGKLFEQFFRLDTSRATATGGSGLGLAIAKEIIELHHGTISASSEKESIAFSFVLPLSVKDL